MKIKTTYFIYLIGLLLIGGTASAQDVNVELYNQTFNSCTAGAPPNCGTYTGAQLTGTQFYINNSTAACTINGKTLSLSNVTSTGGVTVTNICTYGETAVDLQLYFNAINLTNWTNIRLEYDWKGSAEGNGFDFAKAIYSLDGGTFADVPNSDEIANGGLTTDIVDFNAADNEGTVYIGFRWTQDGINDGSLFGPVAIDNVKIFGDCSLQRPAISLQSGNSTFCEGNAAILESTVPGGGGGYQWYKDGNPISGEDQRTLVVTESGDYTVEFVAQECNKVSLAQTIVVNPSPSAPLVTASGPTQVCQGQGGGQLTLTSTAGSTYQWFVDGTLIPGQVFQNIQPQSAGDYVVRITNSQGCEAFSAPTTVNVAPAPDQPFIFATNGETEICPGQSVELNSTESGNLQWYLDGVAISGADAQNYFATSPGDYTVEVANGNCKAMSDPYTLSQGQGPVKPTISPNSDTLETCQGSPVALFSSGADGYQWFRDGNKISGATNQAYSASIQGNYTVVTFATGDPCGAESDPVYVVVNPVTIPVATANGPTTFCDGGSVLISSSPSSRYQWFRNGVALANDTNQTYRASQTGSYRVRVTNEHGCEANSNSISVTVSPSPTKPTIVPGGTVNICEGQTRTLTSSSASSYQWFKNGIPINNATSKTYVVSETGSYTVQVSNGSGCSNNSDPTIVNVNQKPDVPVVSNNGPLSFCPGGDVTLTSDQADAYQWYKDGSFISGANGQSYVANTTGAYQVAVSSGAGCTRFSDTVFVTVNVEEKPTVNPNGSLTFCSNETLTLTSSYDSGNQWVKDGVHMNGENGRDLIVNQPGDYYVIVNIQGCEDSSDVVSITELQAPAQPDINPANDTIIICVGETEVFTTTASLPKQWFKNNQPVTGSTNSTFVAASEGYYKVQVTDSNNGCTEFSDSVFLRVIFENPPIVEPGDLTICSNETGFLYSNYQGQGADIQWKRNGNPLPFAKEDSLEVSNPGDYSYDIVLEGCTATSNEVSVTVNSAPNGTQIVAGGSTTFCPGGSVTLQSTQANAYQWHKDDKVITGEESQNYQAFDEGDYYVVVFNAAGCADTSNTISVDHNAQPEILGVNIEDNLCEGVSEGSAEIIVTDGAAPYSYSLDNQVYYASNTFDNLVAGDYIAYVLDVNNCMDTMSFTIENVVTNLSVSAGLNKDITCRDDNDAIIRATGSGGDGQYMYSLNGGPFQTQRNFTNLGEGSYVITMTDGNGCTAESNTITITNPDSLKITQTVVNEITCHDENNGVIEASVVGGVPPYKYSIDGGLTFKNSPSFTNLGPGVYRIRVKDKNGCIKVVSRRDTLTNPKEVELLSAVKVADALCFGQANGQINVFAKGGFNDSLEYSADGINWQWMDSVLMVPAGTYQVVVRDPHGCTDTAANIITVNQPEQITGSIAVLNHVSCNGGSDASIVVTASGGTPPLKYSIDNGATYQSEDVITGLSSGLTSVLVEDTNGCTITLSTFLFQPQPFTLSATLTKDISCFGEDDAVIACIPSGGAPGQKEYSLDNGQNWQTNNVFADLGPGNYTPMVRDKNGCTASAQPIQVTSPPQIFVSVNASNVSCNGAGDAFLTITASGGLGNLQYSIDGGNTYSTTSDYQGIAPGTYQVIVKDGSDCEKDGGFFTITEPSALTLSAVIDQNESCFGSEDAQVSAFVSGGNPPYTFQLNGLNDQIDDGVYEDLASGDYVVTVTDANGCTDTTDTLNISAPDAVVIDSVFISHISCKGNVDGQIMVKASGGVGDSISYSIDGANFTGDSIFTSLPAGNYTVVVRDEANGCLSEVKLVSIIEPGLLTIAPVIDNHVTCSGLQDGQISASITGGTPPYLYSIDNGTTLQVDSFFGGLPAGNYSLYVVDSEGCTASSISTTVLNPVALSITANISKPMTCNGANDAIIVANGQGGTGDLSFSINSGPWQSSPSFDSLAAGIYVVSVQDENGCIQNAPAITIQNPPVLNFSAMVTKEVSCFGASDGQIVVTASGGVGTKFYSKDGGITYQSSNTFSNLSFDLYTIQVKDANNCIHDTVIQMNQPNAIQVQANVVNESNMGNDGSISLNVTGGTPPYTYNWTNGDSTATITGLEGGNYSVVIVDANGCQKVFTQTISSSVSLEEDGLEAIRVYPNPATTQFTIEIPATIGKVEYVIYNELGEIMTQAQKRGGQNLNIAVEKWPKGVYMIRYISSGDTHVESIVIQ